MKLMNKLMNLAAVLAAVAFFGAPLGLRAEDAATKDNAVTRDKVEDSRVRQRRQTLTPEQREARRKEMRERLDQRLTDLRKKKTDGTITETEQKQLDRLETAAKNRRRHPPASTDPGKTGAGADQKPANNSTK